MCIVLPIFLFISLAVILAPEINKKNTTLKVNKKWMKSLQTGDLLFLSGVSPMERGIRTIQGGEFSHVCLVIKDKYNKAHVIEVDNHPKKEMIGAHIMSLETKNKS